jgi:N-acetylmuramoyl-L-alanine amidase
MKRKINQIVIHCAATPNGKPFTISDIDNMHKARGFKRDSQAARNLNPHLKSVGYHRVIEIDGTISVGRGFEEIGAHVHGNNAHSIGICMIGTDKFTQSQWMALRQCVIDTIGHISSRTIITAESAANTLKDIKVSIKGHRDYSPDLNGDGQITRNEWIKDCPNFDVATWFKGGMMPVNEALL